MPDNRQTNAESNLKVVFGDPVDVSEPHESEKHPLHDIRELFEKTRTEDLIYLIHELASIVKDRSEHFINIPSPSEILKRVKEKEAAAASV